MQQLRASFEKLQSSIAKQWGSIPSEIAGEMNEISLQISDMENKADVPPAVTENV